MRPELEQHYRTLELAPGASFAEVRRAYRDLAQVWHPDRFASHPRLRQVAEEKLRALNAALEALEAVEAERASTAPPGQSAPRSQRGTPAPPATPARATPSRSAAQRCTLHRAGFDLSRVKWPSVRWLSNAWVRTAAFAVLFVGVLAGARGLYQVLHRPAQLAESILQDAARMAGRPHGLSQSALHGLDPGVPGLGSIGRFSHLWATAPRRFTPELVSPLAAPTAAGTAPARPRPPRPDEEGYLALPNGTELAPPRGKKGFGAIRIVNQTEEEAAVELVSELAPANALRLVYIRAGMDATVRGIGPGVYYLSVRLGEEWLPRSRDFARRRARGGPVGPLPFFQFHAAEGVSADTYEIVLKPEAMRR